MHDDADAITTVLRAHVRACPISAKSRMQARRIRIVASALVAVGATAPAWRTMDLAIPTSGIAIYKHALFSHLVIAVIPSAVVCAGRPSATAIGGSAYHAATSDLKEALPPIAQAYLRLAERMVADDDGAHQHIATTWGALAAIARDRSEAMPEWWAESADFLSDDLGDADVITISRLLAAMHAAAVEIIEKQGSPSRTAPQQTIGGPMGTTLRRAPSPTPKPAAKPPVGLARIRTAVEAIRTDGLVMPDDILIPLVRRALGNWPAVALLWGRSGSGKTMTASLVAKHTHCGYVAADASRLVGAGFRGETVGSIIGRVAAAMNSHRRVILLLDECDKLAHGDGDKNWGDTLRGQLLVLLGGGDASGDVGDRDGSAASADMSRVVVLLAGSFATIGDATPGSATYGLAAADEDGDATPMGFALAKPVGKKASPQMTDHDRLLKLGGFWSPEVVGRIGCILRMPDLARDALVSIAHRHRHDATIAAASLGVEQRLLDQCPSAEDLADDALGRGLGARWIATRLAAWQDRAVATAISGVAAGSEYEPLDEEADRAMQARWAAAEARMDAEECGGDDASEYFPAELQALHDSESDDETVERLSAEAA